MIEILAKNIERLFSDTTNRKYCSDRFDVWEISDEVFSALCGMSDEEFEQFAQFHLATCEKRELLGSSSHLLYICKKAN